MADGTLGPPSVAATSPATTVLCVNVGSSSVKAACFTVDGDARRERWRTNLERADGTTPDLEPVRAALIAEGLPEPSVVGHRVVHGGSRVQAAVVDDALVAELDALRAFAPLHQPACLEGIAAARESFPDATHVASFDTAFHHTMPEVATHLGLPHELWERGVRRYGFHGLSYTHVVETLGADRLGRSVVAHLGSGASLAAIDHGRSVDTTMGLTPAGGVVMSTRTGDLDPGVLIHLLRHGVDGSGPLDADGLEQLVNHRSGLLGLSGSTPDMRRLFTARGDGDARAALAVEVFCRTVAMRVGAYAAALGGIDSLVFTAGIGEHEPQVRAEVCAPLGFLGIEIDAEANAARAPDLATISTTGSAVEVLVVPADEERVMAREALDATGGAAATGDPPPR